VHVVFVYCADASIVIVCPAGVAAVPHFTSKFSGHVADAIFWLKLSVYVLPVTSESAGVNAHAFAA
jgi:hypothetical protein